MVRTKSLTRQEGLGYRARGGLRAAGNAPPLQEGRQMWAAWEIWKMRQFWCDCFYFYFLFYFLVKHEEKSLAGLGVRNGRACRLFEGSCEVVSLWWGCRVTEQGHVMWFPAPQTPCTYNSTERFGATRNAGRVKVWEWGIHMLPCTHLDKSLKLNT